MAKWYASPRKMCMVAGTATITARIQANRASMAATFVAGPFSTANMITRKPTRRDSGAQQKIVIAAYVRTVNFGGPREEEMTHQQILDETAALNAAARILGECHTVLLREYTFWCFIKDIFTRRHTRAWKATRHAQKYLFARFDEINAQW